MRTTALKVVCQVDDLFGRLQISCKEDDPAGLAFFDERRKFCRHGCTVKADHEELSDLILRDRHACVLSGFSERLIRNWINSLVPIPVGPLGM